MNPRVLVAVLSILVVGCSEQPSTASPSAAPPVVVATTPPISPVPSSTTVLPDSTVATTSAPEVATDGVHVEGGTLPSSVTDEQLALFGELLDPLTFMERYHLGRMPYADGPDVVVVDHQQLVQRFDDGARRFDTLTYAFMDERAAPQILDAFASTIGVELRIGSAVRVTGGRCTEASNDAQPFTFIVCDRDDGSRTLQVVRQQWVAGDQTPPAEVQASLASAAPVVAGVNGTLAVWDLRRSTSFPGGQAVSLDFDATSASSDTLGALLPGWVEQPNSGYGVEFTNGTEVWFITETGVLFANPHPSAWM